MQQAQHPRSLGRVQPTLLCGSGAYRWAQRHGLETAAAAQWEKYNVTQVCVILQEARKFKMHQRQNVSSMQQKGKCLWEMGPACNIVGMGRKMTCLQLILRCVYPLPNTAAIWIVCDTIPTHGSRVFQAEEDVTKEIALTMICDTEYTLLMLPIWLLHPPFPHTPATA